MTLLNRNNSDWSWHGAPSILDLWPATSVTLLTRNCRISPQDEPSSRSAGLGAMQTNMTGSRPSLGGGLGGALSASGGLSGTGLSGGLSTSGLSGATAMSTAGGAQAMPHFDCDGDITPPFSSINRPYLWVCPPKQMLNVSFYQVLNRLKRKESWLQHKHTTNYTHRFTHP